MPWLLTKFAQLCYSLLVDMLIGTLLISAIAIDYIDQVFYFILHCFGFMHVYKVILRIKCDLELYLYSVLLCLIVL